MDVLLYQSGYCEHISNIVKQECNRLLQLYKKRNPTFKGSVSLCGHSLGSAILFDILCHQPNEVDAAKMGRSTGDDSDRRSALNFECEEFFCLGSPIALFQMLKGKTVAGFSPLGARSRKSALDVELGPKTPGSAQHSKRDSQSSVRHEVHGPAAIISAPKCRDLYNIFHPSDPVSYRIEPLISPAMASLKPQPLPSVKKSLWTTSGQSLSILRDRMGQSVGSLWTNFTTGVASSLLNRSLGLNAEETSSATYAGGKSADGQSGHTRTPSRPVQDTADSEDHMHTLIDSDLETLYDGFQKSRDAHRRDQARSSGDAESELESDDQERKLKFEDAKVRALNSNGRVDYSIQESVNPDACLDWTNLFLPEAHLTFH